jgi:hypothetical protein
MHHHPIVTMRLPPQGVYLVADTADAADAWVDALVLGQHLVATRSHEALAEALTPQLSRRPKQAALAGGGGRQGGSPHGGISIGGSGVGAL